MQKLNRVWNGLLSSASMEHPKFFAWLQKFWIEWAKSISSCLFCEIFESFSKIFAIFKIIDIVEDFLRTENFFNKFEIEFYAFKIAQILQYLNRFHNENYFNIAKEKFEELKIIFTKNMEEQLKDSVYNWNDYLNVLNSNSIQEYLENRWN